MEFTFDSQACALGQVLRNWRAHNGITLYSIAKYENTRIENIMKVEEGVANMVNLCRYLDYIQAKDDVFFDKILIRWRQALGY